MKKVFLSQPMDGLTHEEIIETRNEMIKYVQSKFSTEEFIIINSYHEDNLGNPLQMLIKSLNDLSTADLAIFHPDYNNFGDCKIEYDCANEYDIPIEIMEYYNKDEIKLNESINIMINNVIQLKYFSENDFKKLDKFYKEIKDNYPGINSVTNIEFKIFNKTIGIFFTATIEGVLRRYYFTFEDDCVSMEFEDKKEHIMTRLIIYKYRKYNEENINMINNIIINNKFDFISIAMKSIIMNL